MSITDELREFIEDKAWMANNYAKALAIADRIDAEHESKVSYWQGASHKDGYDEGFKDGYDEGFASADDWLAQHEDAMAEHGWVRLPKDADGEYIHIGDVMDSKVDYLFDGRPFEVRALVLCEGEWEAADSRFGNRYEPNSLRHYHAPTVEDVLREFGDWYAHTKGGCDEDGIIAEYAAKLRLAGDAE